jgi:hypothetical protein
MDDWPNEDYVDVYFFKTCTVILFNIDLFALSFLIQGESTFSFAFLETSRSFSNIYTKNASVQRVISLHDDRDMNSEGEPLDFESEIIIQMNGFINFLKKSPEFLFGIFNRILGSKIKG